MANKHLDLIDPVRIVTTKEIEQLWHSLVASTPGHHATRVETASDNMAQHGG